MPFRTTRIPIEIIPLKGDGYHCFVNVIINGKIPARMILDTGASRTVFDYNMILKTELAGQLEANEEKATGLGTNTMEGFTLELDSLQLGEVEIRDYTAGILDISHVNETYEMIGLPGINGAIGSDVLFSYRAKIDYHKKTLCLSINPVRHKKRR